ncbi:Glycoside hydrolase, catalytic core [Beauveria bassiana ARSEF 2860]|uniref:Glycoside hydrolase, catalytic core n=1 Tax=Beauveria bassiana (strain ARSEF 2860) TaxID=655819 RepID=J4WB94_BEAB2|nr:Glycoside hydrolase, catalytic core [Beauveria bassiana ARSEF 2860]EJP67390.1 Glycoside hydrolase, catalytic core [Beauveria bassiana ARSEF 2860]
MLQSAAFVLLLAGSGVWAAATSEPLISGAGQKAAIPRWDFRSTAGLADKDLAKLSQAGGVDTSSWHHVEASRCTLMGCLLENGEYKDSDLWFSNNLEHFNGTRFAVPWVYRSEFALPGAADRRRRPPRRQHFLLETNGISSKADLYLNGRQVADAAFQAGAYAGHIYDVTELVAAKEEEANALLVRVHPTQYLYDFAVGFVDWNPYPPDNGTGIWRDITVKQTGPVAMMGPLSIAVDAPLPIGERDATVTVRVRATNLENTTSVEMAARAVVSDPSGAVVGTQNRSVVLAAGESRYVEFKQVVRNPKIWWPKAWGAQPLYTAKVDFFVGGGSGSGGGGGGGGGVVASDTATSTFGIRTVTAALNAHNDTLFTVNGHPLQVLGGGYSADMFLRWDAARFALIARYVLDMGQNAIRLEGKMEQPELYAVADRLGLLVLVGWECCDKWEAWAYNHDLAVDPPPVWDDRDYAIANASIVHEAGVLQTHPSVMGFLVGSDYWPDDRATKMYVDGLRAAGWQVPIVASASKRGYPALLGPSGMKMDGPYDWVPPSYWFDTNDDDGNGNGKGRYGAAFGFGSELGAGVGTPELGSLHKFLTAADREDLWRAPDKGLYHMNKRSQFYTRSIYNRGLWARFGAPTSLEDYLMKAQLTDYEATRAQYEAYSALWRSATRRPATGLVYWMLNNAWPSLHWNQFDHYMRPAGSYFGTKTASRVEHVAFDYVSRGVWLINRSLDRRGARRVEVDVVDMKGRIVSRQTMASATEPNTSRKIGTVEGLDRVEEVVFLRLRLYRDNNNNNITNNNTITNNTITNNNITTNNNNNRAVVSRNVYWLGPGVVDVLDWKNSTWYHTPVKKYVDYTSLRKLETASVDVKVGSRTCRSGSTTEGGGVRGRRVITLQNKSGVPAFFVSLNLVDAAGEDALPVLWSDNYVTLWPNETLKLTVGQWDDGAEAVEVKGFNVKTTSISF